MSSRHGRETRQAWGLSWGSVRAALAACGLAYGLASLLGEVRPRWPALAFLIVAGVRRPGSRRPVRSVPKTLRPQVGHVVAGLGRDGFVALQDVSLGHTELDHVVIGPPGIFVLTAADEDEEAAAERLREHARRLADRVGSIVEPVVVSPSGRSLPAVEGVPVVPLDHLGAWLRERRARWTRARVETVHQTVLEILGMAREGILSRRRSA